MYLTLQYKDSTLLSLYKTQLGCVKNGSLNKLLAILNILYHISTHKFVKIHINSNNYVCYKFFQLRFQYEHFTTLISHKN
jgi:hypothetical protein